MAGKYLWSSGNLVYILNVSKENSEIRFTHFDQTYTLASTLPLTPQVFCLSKLDS